MNLLQDGTIELSFGFSLLPQHGCNASCGWAFSHQFHWSPQTHTDEVEGRGCPLPCVRNQNPIPRGSGEMSGKETLRSVWISLLWCIKKYLKV